MICSETVECWHMPFSICLLEIKQSLEGHFIAMGSTIIIKITMIFPYSQDGNTPLHLAVLRMDCESVALLLKHGKRCLNSTNKVNHPGHSTDKLEGIRYTP